MVLISALLAVSMPLNFLGMVSLLRRGRSPCLSRSWLLSWYKFCRFSSMAQMLAGGPWMSSSFELMDVDVSLSLISCARRELFAELSDCAICSICLSVSMDDDVELLLASLLVFVSAWSSESRVDTGTDVGEVATVVGG